MEINTSTRKIPSKVCTKCGVRKALTRFYHSKISQDGREKVCKKCRDGQPKKLKPESLQKIKQYKRAYYQAHKEEYKTRSRDGYRARKKRDVDRKERRRQSLFKYRLKKYGLTLQQFDALQLQQAGCCAVCGSTLDHTCHVDHDHSTGRVSGLLCCHCNHGLGEFRDDVDLLRKAIQYVQDGSLTQGNTRR